MKYLCISIAFLFFFFHDNDAQQALKVYVDCEDCDLNFLKRELNWVEYVRDEAQSDVFIWSLDQTTGSGGKNYLIRFMGKGELESINFELSHQTGPTITEAEEQAGLVQVIASGLLPYEVKMGKEPRFKLTGNDENSMIPPGKKDSWRHWVFEIGMDAEMELESSQREVEMEGNLAARHTTETWRIRSELEYKYALKTIHNEEIDFNHRFTQSDFEFSVVRSLSDHWSTGIFTEVWDNSARNTALGSKVNAALEYNFYPYWQSHQKEFTVAYYLGPAYMQYLEETIYDHTRQTLMGQHISIEYRLQQPWGSLEFDLDGYQWLNDLSKNRLDLEAEARIRIVKGLSFRLQTEYQIIHDQLYLPKGGASIEEILLKRASLATNYYFDFRVGLVYTFGSIYNSIVNTRL